MAFINQLPVFIFYTQGYRISFDNEERAIVTTGGIYVTNSNLDVSVFLDEKFIDKPRLFRSAYYIQNIENGIRTFVRIISQRQYGKNITTSYINYWSDDYCIDSTDYYS